MRNFRYSILIAMCFFTFKLTAQGSLFKGDVFVEGTTVVSGQYISNTNPSLVFESDSKSRFTFSYNSLNQKLTISENNGVPSNVLEIKDGILYLPNYSGLNEENLSVGVEGELIRTPKTNRTFNFFDFNDPSIFSTYTNVKKGVQLQNNIELTGISAHVMDNNTTGNSGVDNTIFIVLRRLSKINNSSLSEEVFRISGTDTPSNMYTEMSTTTVVTPDSNIIDNDNYIYYLEIYYCNDCSFREVKIN